jgi:hypothetical protein
MSELLACRRGAVSIMTGCGGVPGIISIEGFEPIASIIDSPSLEQSVNAQFMTSLEDATYVYVFGDKMGTATIQGTAFAARCGAGEPNSNENGLRDIVEYYNTRRASQDKRLISISFGPERISAFLMGARIFSKDPLHVLLGYNFTFSTLPKRALSRNGNGA